MKLYKRKLFRLVVISGSILLVIVLSQSVLSLLEKRDIVRRRATELSRVEAENKELNKKLTEVDTPLFIEREARDKLGLVKPGESIVLLQRNASNSAVVDRQAYQQVSTIEQWLKLFF